MTNVILIKNPNKLISTEEVLVQNGFAIISSWAYDGIYEKEGIKYKSSFPVWEWKTNKVRIEKI